MWMLIDAGFAGVRQVPQDRSRPRATWLPLRRGERKAEQSQCSGRAVVALLACYDLLMSAAEKLLAEALALPIPERAKLLAASRKASCLKRMNLDRRSPAKAMALPGMRGRPRVNKGPSQTAKAHRSCG